MTIEKIKSSIDDKLGNHVNIVCNGTRNRKEYYKGRIIETYSYIFIVKLDSNETKSFCYSDVLTNNVRLYFDKNV